MKEKTEREERSMKMQQWTVGILLFDQVDLTDITGPSEGQ